MEITIRPIGVVHNAISEQTSPDNIKVLRSIIEVYPEYAEGLQGIEEDQYLEILFHIHKNECERLVNTLHDNSVRGVFASRTPCRPNHIGLTTVKLLKVEGNKLTVTGLDALDESPVIDIKCCDTSLYDNETIHNSVLGNNPRIDIDKAIRAGDLESLMYKTGQLHGHICPGIAMGVLAGENIMKLIADRGEDPFEYSLVAEQPNCVLDGIMFVTGFTPGKRKLTMKPGNKMHYEILNEKGKGWILETDDHNREFMNSMIDDSLPKLEKAIQTLKLDFEKMFDIKEIK